MGLTTPSDDVIFYREELAGRTAPHEQTRAKICLAWALTKIDQPEYVEAIKLWGEVVASTRLAFGPDHSLSLYSEQKQAEVKEEYRDYLHSIATEK